LIVKVATAGVDLGCSIIRLADQGSSATTASQAKVSQL